MSAPMRTRLGLCSESVATGLVPSDKHGADAVSRVPAGASTFLNTTLVAFAIVLPLVLAALPAFAWDLGDIARDSSATGNVAVDASLESGMWEANGGAIIGQGGSRTGALGGRIQRPDDRTDPRLLSPSFPASPGRRLVSAWLRSAMPHSHDPNYSAVLEVTWLDDTGGALETARAGAVNGHSHVWVYRENVLTAPPGTTKGRLVFRFNWSATGLAELDDVAVAPAPDSPGTDASLQLSLRAVKRIFEPGEPLAVRASVRLTEGLERTIRLRMDVVDARGALLTSAATECLARADRPTEIDLTAAPIETPLREHLRARITTDPPQPEPEEFGLLAIPRPTDFSLKEDSPFALLVGHPYTKRWLGARWERPNFNWNEREMELARRYGVIYVGMFNSANRALAGSMPLEDYGAYVYESVSRFKHLVKYWQLGNEPNLYQPGVPERWAEILRVGYEAAKRADPGCKVMWGGITGLNVDPDMVDKLLAAGGGDYTDIIDVHLYVPIPEMDRLLTKVRADMAKHSVDKPIVITEVTGALGVALPERRKAGHVYKRYAVAESHGVLASWWFVMHWVNTGEFRYCSLIDPGTGEPHEAAAAYARLTDALAGAEFASRIDCGEDAWVYRWRKGDRAIYIAWAEGDDAGGCATLPCGPGPATITDVAGHQWKLDADGALTINLRDEPLLIDAPAPAAGGPTRELEFNPPRLSVARGASASASLPDLPGRLALDIPRGLRVARSSPRTLAITANPDARLGDHWVIVRTVPDSDAEVGKRHAAFLRLKVTVTPPLVLAMTPLPRAGASGTETHAVLARITNLSGAPLTGTLALLSPVSSGPRPDHISVPFAGLRPHGIGEITMPLNGPTDPLARSNFTLTVQTGAGVRDTLHRVLVFTPATRAHAPPTIDGDLSDWPDVFPITVGLDTGERGDPDDGPPSSPDDLSARAALRWDDDALYLAVCVRDDIHKADQRDGALWDGDGLQLGFAPEPYAPNGPYYEWGVALTEEGVQAWSWRAVPREPTGEIHFPCKIVRRGGETLYEAQIPWTMLTPIRPELGATFGFGLCVNERDTANRGYYGWHGGIAGEKNPMRFGQVTLTHR